MTYFSSAPFKVSSGEVVYAKDLNDPLLSIQTGFAALVDDLQNDTKIHYAPDTGSADTYSLDLDPDPVSYTEGLNVWLKPANSCTGASTLNVNSLGAIDIQRVGFEALSAGDLQAGFYVQLKYSASANVFLVVSTGVSEIRSETSAAAAAVSEANAWLSETASGLSETNAGLSKVAAAASAAEAESIVLSARDDSMTIDSHVATALQTDFTITDAVSAENLLVFMNSRRLSYPGDYSVDSILAATKIILASGAAVSDEINIISFSFIAIEGADGSFTSADGKIITVVGGIIKTIV